MTASEPAGSRRLRVAMLTREYPPDVYGGAGVHVEYLVRSLAPLVELTVHCEGEDRPGAVRVVVRMVVEKATGRPGG